MDSCRDGMPRIEAKVVEDPHASPSAADVMHMASRSSYRVTAEATKAGGLDAFRLLQRSLVHNK